VVHIADYLIRQARRENICRILLTLDYRVASISKAVCSFKELIIDFEFNHLAAKPGFYPMLIMRLIILLIVVVTLLWLLKRLFSGDPAPEQLKSGEPENMRQCKYCGVHVPESTILVAKDEPYCCQEHADLDQH
jgi:uncharacterized protein